VTEAKLNVPGGLRERNRVETKRRIADAGIKLFAAQGYDQTTIDAIAEAAGISRRTFFHYFASKDEILATLQVGLGATLVDALARVPDGTPLWPALRKAMLLAIEPYAGEDLIKIDRLMRSSEAIQTRKLASYASDEMLLFETFSKRWPERPVLDLRMAAMTTIGLARVSLDVWSRDGGIRPLSTYVEAACEALGPDLLTG